MSNLFFISIIILLGLGVSVPSFSDQEIYLNPGQSVTIKPEVKTRVSCGKSSENGGWKFLGCVDDIVNLCSQLANNQGYWSHYSQNDPWKCSGFDRIACYGR